MTPHKYDHILIYTNPIKYKFKKTNPTTKYTKYIDPKFIQTRIFFKCESDYFKNKKQ